jgi:hypothetical protein
LKGSGSNATNTMSGSALQSFCDTEKVGRAIADATITSPSIIAEPAFSLKNGN